MKKLYVLFASAALIAGCVDRANAPIATSPTTPVSTKAPAIAAKVDQLERRYLALRPVAELLLPYLPEATALRIGMLLDGIDKAIAIARVTSSAASAKAEVDNAARALDELQRTTGPAPS